MFTDPRPQGPPVCTQTAAQLLSMRAGTGFGKRFRCLKVTGRCNQTCWHWIWDQDTCLWQKPLIETTVWVTCSALVTPVNSEKGIWSLERCLRRLSVICCSTHTWSSNPFIPTQDAVGRTCQYWTAIHQHYWTAIDHSCQLRAQVEPVLDSAPCWVHAP